MTKIRICDFRRKEVINIRDGHRLGFVYDIVVDIKTGQVVAIIVEGPAKFCGLFIREKEYVIPWCSIKKIGEDIIIIDVDKKEIFKDMHRPKF